MFRNWLIAREGWYYLFVLAFILGGAILRDVNLLYILAGMMIGPLLFNWRLAVMMLRGLQVTRHFPQRVFAGEIFHVELEVANRRQWLDSRAIIVRDYVRRISPHVPSAARSRTTSVDVLFPRVTVGEKALREYCLMVPARGHYVLPQMLVSSRYPLGLVHAFLRVENQQPLIVYPQRGRLTQQWLRVIESDQQGSGQSVRQQGVAEGEFYALRDWRNGDSKRWIHWRTSAKVNDLVVRQFEQQRNEGLCLLLDLAISESPTMEELIAVELAVSFAASAISDLAHRGAYSLHVAVAGDRPFEHHGVVSGAMTQEWLDHLSAVSGACDNGLEKIATRLVGQLKANTKIVVITTRDLSSGSGAEMEQLEATILASKDAHVIEVRQDLDRYFELDEGPAF